MVENMGESVYRPNTGDMEQQHWGHGTTLGIWQKIGDMALIREDNKLLPS